MNRRSLIGSTARPLAPALLAFGVALAHAQTQPADVPVKTDPAPAPAPVPVAPAPATKPENLDRVEITGQKNATDERRLSTASKIVIGRDEIEQYGDQSLGDVLRRLPGVTLGGRPGRGGGQVRMRGMGSGYTQILIDGERIPPGFSLEQISPDMVERIEILRAPTAETGARAIAGTINIVLREPLRRQTDDVRLGVGSERGHLQPSASWTHNDTLGTRGTYNVTASGSRTNQYTDTRSDTTYTNLATGQTDLAQRLDSHQHDTKDSFYLSSRVQWSLGAGEQVSVQPFVVFTHSDSTGRGLLDQSVGATPAPYAISRSEGEGSTQLGRLLFQLRKRLGDATRVDASGNVGRLHTQSIGALDQFAADGSPGLNQRTRTTIRDRSWSLNTKLTHQWLDQHALAGGLEAESTDRNEQAITLLNGAPAIADFDGNVAASVHRYAAYAQDEWDLSPAWAVYGGLRWERIETRSDSLGTPVDNTSNVLTPLLHTVWRFDPPSRDQVRLSLTRSYRTPTLASLVGVPRFSTLNPPPGANTASSPDRTGNPDLRPELATGIDLAFERYLANGGVVTVSVFRRQIDHLIRNVTTLQTVPWATSQRWVAQPRNIGDAVSQGIEFDAKMRLDALFAGGAPWSVHANLSVYDSHVSGVPGPYNRIDQQPRASTNVGAEYRVRAVPVTIGANLSWVPPYTVQQTDVQRQSFEVSRVVDAFVLYSINPNTRLRLSVANVVPRSYVTTSTIVADGQSQVVVSNGPTYRSVSLKLELRL